MRQHAGPSAVRSARPTHLLLSRPFAPRPRPRAPLFLSRSPEHENGPMTATATSHAKSHSTQDFPSDVQRQRAEAALPGARVIGPSVVRGGDCHCLWKPGASLLTFHRRRWRMNSTYYVRNLPSPLEASRCDYRLPCRARTTPRSFATILVHSCNASTRAKYAPTDPTT